MKKMLESKKELEGGSHSQQAGQKKTEIVRLRENTGIYTHFFHCLLILAFERSFIFRGFKIES